RDEPHEELRRQHLPEDDEGAHRPRTGAEQPTAIRWPAGEPDPDTDDRDELDRRLGEGEPVRERADEVLRPVAVPLGDAEIEDLMADEQEAGAERLDLQRP